MKACAPRKIWVWMDVSAACSLACRDCYTKHTHEPALLTPAQFEDILRRFQRKDLAVQKLHLNWRGEPLINKRLPDLLARRREILPDPPLEFHTHGLLVSPEVAAAVISATAEKDRIYVSIDGGWPDAHERNRGSGTWSGALSGLRALLDARDRQGTGPMIGIYEIAYGRHTRAHPALVALSRRCDEWTRVAPLGPRGEEATFDDGAAPAGPCFWAGNALCVTARGDVHVCLLSFRPEGRLGNIFYDELMDILERATAFRGAITAGGRARLVHCRGCRKTEGVFDDEEFADY